MAITLSILNGFSKFFHYWEERKIANKTHVTFPTIPSVCCRTTLQKLEVQIYGNSKKNQKIVSDLTKTETFLVTWLHIVTVVARNVCLLPAHMRGDIYVRHSSITLTMMVWSMPCQTCRKCCFSSQHLFR